MAPRDRPEADALFLAARGESHLPGCDPSTSLRVVLSRSKDEGTETHHRGTASTEIHRVSLCLCASVAKISVPHRPIRFHQGLLDDSPAADQPDEKQHHRDDQQHPDEIAEGVAADHPE